VSLLRAPVATAGIAAPRVGRRVRQPVGADLHGAALAQHRHPCALPAVTTTGVDDALEGEARLGERVAQLLVRDAVLVEGDGDDVRGDVRVDPVDTVDVAERSVDGLLAALAVDPGDLEAPLLHPCAPGFGCGEHGASTDAKVNLTGAVRSGSTSSCL
jgi:hypothetical protein